MEPLLVLVLVFGGIVLGGWAMRALARRQRGRVVEAMQLDPAEQPRILSFYGPSCDACDRQKVVLEQLEQARPGGIAIDSRDASVEYDYARQFGLTVVPTTVVIAPSGTIAAINSGFTSRTTLESQLDAAA